MRTLAEECAAEGHPLEPIDYALSRCACGQESFELDTHCPRCGCELDDHDRAEGICEGCDREVIEQILRNA